jgi:hypothetical protein
MSHTGCVCPIVGDLETATMKQPRPQLGSFVTEKNHGVYTKDKALGDNVPCQNFVSSKSRTRLEWRVEINVGQVGCTENIGPVAEK